MKLSDLLPSLQLMATSQAPSDLRAVTYFTTYPSILALGSSNPSLQLADLHQLCLVAYGWMPRIARLDPKHTRAALVAIQNARSAIPQNIKNSDVSDLAIYLRSVVGASKVLHFVNPEVYPIWDSNIERFRQKSDPTTSYMSDASNYVSYIREVHSIRAEPGFTNFHAQFNSALAVWLAAVGTNAYTVTEVRAVELAAFELSR